MQLFSSIKNVGVRYGVAAGVFTLIYFGAFYFVSKAWMLSPIVYYGSLIIYLWAMYQAFKEDSFQEKATISFRRALRTGFLVFLIANAIFMGFYLFLHEMDPEIVEIQRANLAEWYPRIIPKDQLAQRLRELEKADLKMTPSKAIFAYARASIGGFILAALLALVYRRDAIKF